MWTDRGKVILPLSQAKVLILTEIVLRSAACGTEFRVTAQNMITSLWVLIPVRDRTGISAEGRLSWDIFVHESFSCSFSRFSLQSLKRSGDLINTMKIEIAINFHSTKYILY